MIGWLLELLNGLGSDEDDSPETVLDYLGMTAADLSSHVFLCGQTGSGKTSVIKMLLEAVLWLVLPGAVHCCVKADEADWICKLVRRTPLRSRLMRLIPGQFTFNFAAFECGREGGSPATLARLLMRLNQQLRRSTGGDNEQSFWKNLFFDYMQFGIELAWLAYGPLMTLEHIHDVITTSPSSSEQAKSKDFLTSHFWRILKLAEANVTTQAQARAFERAAGFYLKKQIHLGAKARGAGVQECSSLLGIFLLSPFYETFCASESSFTPDMPLRRYYVVLDAPVLVHQDAGRLFQSLITMMTIEAALRQKSAKHYVLIVRDEFQLLVSDPLFETLAHSVARSHKLSFWSAVQNLPLLHASMGGNSQAEQEMKALLANYGTKLLMANSCMDVTNRYFSTMFGQHKDQFHNFSERPPQPEPGNMMEALFGPSDFQFGTSESFADRVPPDAFLKLRRGGPPHYLIDAYMSQAGRVFPETGLPYRLVTFSQR